VASPDAALVPVLALAVGLGPGAALVLAVGLVKGLVKGLALAVAAGGVFAAGRLALAARPPTTAGKRLAVRKSNQRSGNTLIGPLGHVEDGMPQILLVAGEGAHSLAVLEKALAKQEEVRLHRVNSGAEAQASLAGGWAQAVVVAEELADGPSLPWLREMVKRYPLVNWALVSPLPPEEFHQATEGLGIFLQLPVEPGAAEAAQLLALLAKIETLLGGGGR
jgi:hypothetical protein